METLGRGWNRVFRKPEGEDSSGSGAGTRLGNQVEGAGSTPAGDTNSGLTPSGTGNNGVQSPFSHPKLAGKSEEEIATLLSVNEAAVREQGQRLSSLEGELRNRRVETPAPTPPREEAIVDSAEFWSNPGKVLAEERKRTVQEVMAQMAQQIAPFQEDMARQREAQAWLDARAEKPDFTQYEPLVKQFVQNMGIKSPDKNTLIFLYHSARSLAAEGNGQPVAAPRSGNDGGNTHRPPPPQHLPANQPLRQQAGNQGKQYRELTENERTIARMKKMTPEQYLDSLEVDILELE